MPLIADNEDAWRLIEKFRAELAVAKAELDGYRNAVGSLTLLGPALVRELAGPHWPDEHEHVQAAARAAELIAGTLLSLERRGLVELDERTRKECQRCTSSS